MSNEKSEVSLLTTRYSFLTSNIMPTIPTTSMETNFMPQAEKVAAIIAITQLIKFYGVPSKYLPLFAIIIGVILEYSDNPTAQGILDGIILGAMTTGSYGVIKNAATYALDPKDKKEITIDAEGMNLFQLKNDIEKLEHDDYRGV